MPPDELIQTAIELEISDGTVTADTVGDTPCVFLSGLYHAEKGIADRFRTLISGALPWPDIDADKALPWIEKKTDLILAQSQAEAIRLALHSKVMVITGGPGVGKTTIVNGSVTLSVCARIRRVVNLTKSASCKVEI